MRLKENVTAFENRSTPLLEIRRSAGQLPSTAPPVAERAVEPGRLSATGLPAACQTLADMKRPRYARKAAREAMMQILRRHLSFSS